MLKIPDHIDKLIFDYLSGDLNSENKKTLDTLLSESQELREYKERLEQFWNGQSKDIKSFSAKNAFNKFKQRVIREIEANKHNNRIVHLKPIIRVAVTIAIIITIGYGAFHAGYQSTNQGSPVIIACSPGENATLKLPDGSDVWLNSESSLTYYKDFNKGKRNVYLKGEAFFEVESNKKNPFIVNAANMKVTATGTRFNVMAYENETYLQASLLEGIIEIEANQKKFQLQAGEMISVNKETLKLRKDKILDSDKIIGWRDGKLIFKNEALSDLVRKFERFYDVNFELSPGIDTIRFSGTLQYESIDELIKILDETHGIKVSKDGKTINLKLKTNY